MPSNSLGRNLQVDRLDVNRLKVNALSVANNNDISGYTKDDERLVLITLNLKKADITPDINNSRIGHIKFRVEDLKLTEWEDRSVNSDKKYRSHYNYENVDALYVLKGLFNKKIQGKYNAKENPPNALTIINNIEEENQTYLTILELEITNDSDLRIHYELEENSNSLDYTIETYLTIVIDRFVPNHDIVYWQGRVSTMSERTKTLFNQLIKYHTTNQDVEFDKIRGLIYNATVTGISPEEREFLLNVGADLRNEF